MAHTINVLVNDYNQVPVLLRRLREEGISIGEMRVVHKRADTLRNIFQKEKERPQIIDDDVRPFLRRMDISENDIQYCESRVDHGGTLLMLDVPENSTDRVMSVLKQQHIVVPTSDEMAIGQVLPKGNLMGRGASGLSRLERIQDVRFRVSSFDPTGWKITDPEGDRIGDIKYLIGNSTTGQPLFVAIDCGGLFKDKVVLVPFDRFHFDFDDKEAQLPFDKEQVKNAPNFSDKDTDYGRFTTYWDEVPARGILAHSER